jgi:hypothetical protein
MAGMSLTQIQAELGRLEELRAALVGQARHATNADKIKALEDAQPHIKPKTAQLESLLQAGYGMSVAEAKTVLKERAEDPARWPLEEARKAQAMLAAYEATPQVISKRQPWRRTRG